MSEAAIGGAEGAQRPILHVKEPKIRITELRHATELIEEFVGGAKYGGSWEGPGISLYMYYF